MTRQERSQAVVEWMQAGVEEDEDVVDAGGDAGASGAAPCAWGCCRSGSPVAPARAKERWKPPSERAGPRAYLDSTGRNSPHLYRSWLPGFLVRFCVCCGISEYMEDDWDEIVSC